MNKLKRAFVKILYGFVWYNDDIVPVVIKDYPLDTTPCITIQGMDRTSRQGRRQRSTECHPLPENHPLFDENDPYKKYPTLVEMTTRSYEVVINIWTNNERERELITNQVNDCLFLCLNHHHHYCINYNPLDKTCSTTETICASLKDRGYKGLRGQCPAPIENDYCNLFTNIGIKRNTINIGMDYDMDEYNPKPPLKRTIIEVNFDFVDKRIFPSNPTLCLCEEFNGEEFHRIRMKKEDG